MCTEPRSRFTPRVPTSCARMRRPECRPWSESTRRSHQGRAWWSAVSSSTFATANFEVATGRIVAPRLADTRTNIDFVEHVADTISTDPDSKWIFVVDNLDPHKSEALVRFVSDQIGYHGDLGRMFKSGVLKSRATRTEFLSTPEHRIRFVFTPRHCSWLNQVEIWFSVLARRVLRRGSFKSKEELRRRVLDFIDYFNDVLAKPYRWTYTGKLLTT